MMSRWRFAFGATWIALVACGCANKIAHEDLLDEAQRIKAAAIRALGGVPSQRGIPQRLIITGLENEWARVDAYAPYGKVPEHILVLRRSDRGWRTVWHGRGPRRKLRENLHRLGAPQDLGHSLGVFPEEDPGLRSIGLDSEAPVDRHRRCAGFSFEGWVNDSCGGGTGNGFLLVAPMRSYLLEVERLAPTSRPLDELVVAELASRAPEMGAFSGAHPRAGFVSVGHEGGREWMAVQWLTRDSLRLEYWVERRDGQPPYHFIARSAAKPRLHPGSAILQLTESIRKL